MAYSFIKLYEMMKGLDEKGLLGFFYSFGHSNQEQETQVSGPMLIDGHYLDIYGRRRPPRHLPGCGKRSLSLSSPTTLSTIFWSMAGVTM